MDEINNIIQKEKNDLIVETDKAATADDATDKLISDDEEMSSADSSSSEDENYAEMMLKEDEQVTEWLQGMNMYGNRFVPPVPKHLLIQDHGRRRFSDENVLKRTAWLGMALSITSREQLPEMRRLVIRGRPCITVTTQQPEIAKKLLDLRIIGLCQVYVEKDPVKNTVSEVLVGFNHHARHSDLH